MYPLEGTVCSSKCGYKGCQVCLNLSQTGSFESFQTKGEYKINHRLNCNDKYLPSCKTCGLQYLGSATDRFRLRWNNYKDNDRKAQRGEKHMQPEILEHFHSEERHGFSQDCSIIVIEKTDGSGPTRREEYWHAVLKTVYSYGLNKIN